MKKHEKRHGKVRAAAVEWLAAWRIVEAAHVWVVLGLIDAIFRALGKVVHEAVEIFARRKTEQRKQGRLEVTEVRVPVDIADIADGREELDADDGENEEKQEQQEGDVGKARQRRDQRVEDASQAFEAAHDTQGARHAARAHLHDNDIFTGKTSKREGKRRRTIIDIGPNSLEPVTSCKRMPKLVKTTIVKSKQFQALQIRSP